MAREPADCVAPMPEAQTQRFRGGCNGASSHLLEIDYDAQVKVKQQSGVSVCHDFELRDDGGVIAWRSRQIGRGKKFTKELLDKLCPACEESSSSASNDDGLASPQKSTKATHVTAPPLGNANANASHTTAAAPVKQEKSRRHKQKEREEKETVQAEKRQKREDKKASIVVLKNVRNPHECSDCGQRFPTEGALSGHACRAAATESQAPDEDTIILGSKCEPYSDAEPGVFAKVSMGHGLGSRGTNPLDSVIVKTLEQLLQEGVRKPSSCKGVLEMKEQRKLRLPILLAPDEQSISSWLSSRLDKQKSHNAVAAQAGGNTASSAANGKKSNFTKKQENAAVLSNGNKKYSVVNTEKARQLLMSQHLGVSLEAPEGAADTSSATDIQIITDLVFHEDNGRRNSGCWHVCTKLAVEAEGCKHSTKKCVAASTGGELDIKIASGSKRSPGLGTYVKLFNANEKLQMAFDMVT